MPAILEKLVEKLIRQGHTKQKAYAIATAQLQKSGKLKRKSQKLTEKGRRSR